MSIAPALAAAPVEPLPVFDRAGLLERACGDEDLVGELLADFRAAAPSMIAAVTDAIRRGDVAGAGAAAHRLRGALLAVGAVEAGELARRVEMCAKTGDAPTAQHDALVAALARALEAAR